MAYRLLMKAEICCPLKYYFLVSQHGFSESLPMFFVFFLTPESVVAIKSSTAIPAGHNCEVFPIS